MPPNALGDSPFSVMHNPKEDALMKSFLNSFTIGAAIPGAELNKAERRLLFGNFNTVTPENCMKPAAMQPAKGRFHFAEADALVEMAHANGLTVNGHSLLWHNHCPDWFFHAEGMNIAITELDIDVGKRKTDGADVGALERASADLCANGLPDDVQQRLADQYAQLFALFLKHRDKITRVTFWGLHDERSWLNHWPFKRTNHPLLWTGHRKQSLCYRLCWRLNAGRSTRSPHHSRYDQSHPQGMEAKFQSIKR